MAGLTLGAAIGLCNPASATGRAPRPQSCVLAASAQVAWVFHGGRLQARELKTGAWVGGLGDQGAQPCPGVLTLDDSTWLALLKNQWALLDGKGQVLDEGPLPRGKARLFVSAKVRVLLVDGPELSVMLLEPAKTGWRVNPARAILWPRQGQVAEPVRWCCRQASAPFEKVWRITHLLPGAGDEVVGTARLGQEGLAWRLQVRFTGAAPSLPLGSQDWEARFDQEVDTLAIYGETLVLGRGGREASARRLGNGQEEHWFSPFAFALGQAEAAPAQGSLTLTEKDTGLPIPWDTLLPVPRLGPVDLWLVHDTSFSNHVAWQETLTALPLPGTGEVALSWRWEATPPGGAVARPQRARRLKLGFSPALVMTQEGGLLFLSQSQGHRVDVTGEAKALPPALKPQPAGPLLKTRTLTLSLAQGALVVQRPGGPPVSLPLEGPP